MNYKLHHDKLIARAQQRVLPADVYTERHHIVPRCMGGDNGKGNVVRLTPEEHFVIHQLLVKIFLGNHKLVFALRQLTATPKQLLRNNKEYGWIKKAWGEAMKGNKHTLGFKHSEETKAKMSLSHVGNKNAIGNKNRLGKTHSEETRTKIKLARAAANERSPIMTKEVRAKISASTKGRKGTIPSAETRAKMSIARKKFIAVQSAARE